MTRALVSRETKAVRPLATKPVIWSADQWLPRVTDVVKGCGLALSEVQLSQLAKYMALLQQWNSTYNLTALRQPEDMLTHHLADCLVVIPHLQDHLRSVTKDDAQFQVLDVGSGGGLPGVVLAVACENLTVTCVDTVGKKAAFVRQVSVELSLPRLKAVHARVESLQGSYEVITSRAFASLPDFVSWTHHLLAPAGCWMAMKGVPPDEAECLRLATWASVTSIEPLRVPSLDAQRCLVWMAGNADNLSASDKAIGLAS